jgi:nitrogen regulatory protein P-II 1
MGLALVIQIEDCVSYRKEIDMKRIEAIIRPAMVTAVCAALDKAGHPGVTISAVEGRGNQKGWVSHVRGKSYNVSLLAKARVEVVAKDEDTDQIVTAIREAAVTGEVGDGKIFVHDMANVIRIRTNESGRAAI